MSQNAEYGVGPCCGQNVIVREIVVENRGQYASVHTHFRIGRWQCRVREDHHGELTPTPQIDSSGVTP